MSIVAKDHSGDSKSHRCRNGAAWVIPCNFDQHIPLSPRREHPFVTSRTLRCGAENPASIQQRSAPKSRRRASFKTRRMRVALVGCAHGELDLMYAAVEREAARLPRRGGPGDTAGTTSAGEGAVDLVLCPGDFQAVRNEDDMECMAVPQKYRDMRSFWKYYSGRSVAPYPTIFVGGNHEASNHLQELPLGGLVAPNIYYLGHAGVVNYRGLRIAGISGVYAQHDYDRRRTEQPPYPGNSLKSVYHTRREDIERLRRLRAPVDVFISHDWPFGIVDHGNLPGLLRVKPFLKSDIQNGRFGNPATRELLDLLKPRYWFAAHMHVKFSAVVRHEGCNAETQFLALDKILPRRQFLQIIDIEPSVPLSSVAAFSETDATAPSRKTQFDLDPEWLAILRTPSQTEPVDEEDKAAAQAVVEKAGLSLSVCSPADFERTAREFRPSSKRYGARPSQLKVQSRNQQLADALGFQLSCSQEATTVTCATPSQETFNDFEQNGSRLLECETDTKRARTDAL